MTSDGVRIVQFLFHDLLALFTWRIPGTRTTPLGWAFFILATVAVLKLVKFYFMNGGGSGD